MSMAKNKYRSTVKLLWDSKPVGDPEMPKYNIELRTVEIVLPKNFIYQDLK